MSDKKPEPPPRPPLVLPPNFIDRTAEKVDFIDRTAEKVGTVIGIIGATAALMGKPK
jgi:hypothetical protein